MSLPHLGHESSSGKSISPTVSSSRLLRILYPRFLRLTREGLSDSEILLFSLLCVLPIGPILISSTLNSGRFRINRAILVLHTCPLITLGGQKK